MPSSVEAKPTEQPPVCAFEFHASFRSTAGHGTEDTLAVSFHSICTSLVDHFGLNM